MFLKLLSVTSVNLFRNSPWSVIILPIQIRMFQISAWVSLASLPGIGCWFYNLIFRFIVFSMHQKGICTPCCSSQSKNFVKEGLSAANTKNNEGRCSIIISLVSKFLVLKKPYLKCSINLLLRKKWPTKVSFFQFSQLNSPGLWLCKVGISALNWNQSHKFPFKLFLRKFYLFILLDVD